MIFEKKKPKNKKKKKTHTYSSQSIFSWYCLASDKTALKVAKIFNPLPEDKKTKFRRQKDKIVYLSKVKKLVNDK